MSSGRRKVLLRFCIVDEMLDQVGDGRGGVCGDSAGVKWKFGVLTWGVELAGSR